MGRYPECRCLYDVSRWIDEFVAAFTSWKPLSIIFDPDLRPLDILPSFLMSPAPLHYIHELSSSGGAHAKPRCAPHATSQAINDAAGSGTPIPAT